MIHVRIFLLYFYLFNRPDEFRVLNNTLRKRFRTTSKKIHSVDFNTVLEKYGFPKNWHDNDPLPQIS